MRLLRRLQLAVNVKGTNLLEGILPRFYFSGSNLPALKVLELDAQQDVDLYILDGLALESLVLIATGALEMHTTLCDAPMTTLKHMYLKSGATLAQKYKKKLEASCWSDKPWPELQILEHIREEQGGWVVQVPSNFQPSEFQQCWCGACYDCLVRAGVPILCDQAWTSDGFDKRLRPHCSGVS